MSLLLLLSMLLLAAMLLLLRLPNLAAWKPPASSTTPRCCFHSSSSPRVALKPVSTPVAFSRRLPPPEIPSTTAIGGSGYGRLSPITVSPWPRCTPGNPLAAGRGGLRCLRGGGDKGAKGGANKLCTLASPYPRSPKKSPSKAAR